uniref:Uncharacterized protein n=1 Tax=Anguilla anguilla TaxID=7936 RepID=A0A0E9PI04_ANGAN
MINYLSIIFFCLLCL